MITEKIKKTALKKILNLISNSSDRNLIYAVDIAEKFFIKNNSIKISAENIKKAFREKHPSINLTRNTLKRLSKDSKDKLIENFFINAGIFGIQKQDKVKKNLGFGLPWFFVISPTAKCNLRCKGCYAGGYTKKEDLSFEEVDRIFQEASN